MHVLLINGNAYQGRFDRYQLISNMISIMIDITTKKSNQSKVISIQKHHINVFKSAVLSKNEFTDQIEHFVYEKSLDISKAL